MAKKIKSSQYWRAASIVCADYANKYITLFSRIIESGLDRNDAYHALQKVGDLVDRCGDTEMRLPDGEDLDKNRKEVSLNIKRCLLEIQALTGRNQKRKEYKIHSCEGHSTQKLEEKILNLINNGIDMADKTCKLRHGKWKLEIIKNGLKVRVFEVDPSGDLLLLAKYDLEEK